MRLKEIHVALHSSFAIKNMAYITNMLHCIPHALRHAKLSIFTCWERTHKKISE